MSLILLAREIDNKAKAVSFLQNKGLLHKTRYCEKRHEMLLSLTDDHDRWRCNKKDCRVAIGLRKGTWFETSKLPFETIIFFIYSWSKEYTSTKFCVEELGMSADSITDWKNYLREVCAHSILNNRTKIGGVNKTVEIDESCFSKRKNHVGRVYPQQWVFGGICREDNKCFLYAVPNRSAETLLSTIKECIEPGTIIISDMWKSYSGITNIPDMNYTHITVNHSENFVDPISGAHTQRIESLWSSAKRRNRKECGTSRKLLDSYLCEFLWRKNNQGNDPFEQIIEDIKLFWPPEV